MLFGARTRPCPFHGAHEGQQPHLAVYAELAAGGSSLLCRYWSTAQALLQKLKAAAEARHGPRCLRMCAYVALVQSMTLRVYDVHWGRVDATAAAVEDKGEAGGAGELSEVDRAGEASEQAAEVANGGIH